MDCTVILCYFNYTSLLYDNIGLFYKIQQIAWARAQYRPADSFQNENNNDYFDFETQPLPEKQLVTRIRSLFERNWEEKQLFKRKAIVPLCFHFHSTVCNISRIMKLFVPLLVLAIVSSQCIFRTDLLPFRLRSLYQRLHWCWKLLRVIVLNFRYRTPNVVHHRCYE